MNASSLNATDLIHPSVKPTKEIPLHPCTSTATTPSDVERTILQIPMHTTHPRIRRIPVGTPIHSHSRLIPNEDVAQVGARAVAGAVSEAGGGVHADGLQGALVGPALPEDLWGRC
jgi:hypothetical protein